MEDTKLALNEKGVQALNEFAEKLPQVIDIIDEQTQELKAKCDGLSEQLGVHYEDYVTIIKKIYEALETAKEPINVLSGKMKETAELISNFIKNKVSID